MPPLIVDTVLLRLAYRSDRVKATRRLVFTEKLPKITKWKTPGWLDCAAQTDQLG
jgi:hypothetical protein